MNTDEHDDLWDLLGKAKEAAPSPFLARNVLREIRAQQAQRQQLSLFARLSGGLVRKWKLAAFCGGAIALLALNFSLFTPHSQDQAAAVQLAASSPDFEVIANLDELLASQETSLWIDSSSE